MDEWLKEVPPKLRARFTEIVAITDKFCADRLNDEYRELCREMAMELCQPQTPVAKGKASGWAAGIVYAVGWVNFLTDPAQNPHAKAEEIAKGCGASPATMHARSRVLRRGLELDRFDPTWTLPSQLDRNPYFQIARDLQDAGLLPPGIDIDPATGTIALRFDPTDEAQMEEFLSQLAEAAGIVDEPPLDLFEENPFQEDVLGFRPTPALPAPPRQQRRGR
jgi:hypothetical protein